MSPRSRHRLNRALAEGPLVFIEKRAPVWKGC